jgi:hypothetical protein
MLVAAVHKHSKCDVLLSYSYLCRSIHVGQLGEAITTNSDGSKRIHGDVMKKSVRTEQESIYCTRIDLAQRLDPDIQNWSKGQMWTLRQKLAQGFAPIAPGALDKNGSDQNIILSGP